MEPDKAGKTLTHRTSQRERRELDRFAREPVRAQGIHQQLESASAALYSAHGEDRSFDSPASPPRHDRAG